jgi:hypothetical protein
VAAPTGGTAAGNKPLGDAAGSVWFDGLVLLGAVDGVWGAPGDGGPTGELGLTAPMGGNVVSGSAGGKFPEGTTAGIAGLLGGVAGSLGGIAGVVVPTVCSPNPILSFLTAT